jgi:HKD family nuclease
MANPKLKPVLAEGTDDRSVLIGAPPGFDLLESLRNATAVRVAMAFGHLSGLSKVGDALTQSKAQSVSVLLGQAFFRTEPAVLLELRKLQRQSSQPKFEVKLASVIATFHPKVWIVKDEHSSIGIVGSGNLSGGGLLGNVECGIYTDDPEHLSALEHWFQLHWSIAGALEKTYEDYIKKYQRIEASRKVVEAMTKAATDEQVSVEVTWRRKEALEKAKQYWRSVDGKEAVSDRQAALSRMRAVLDYPSFNFDGHGWDEFLQILELGRIRLGHRKKTIADLPRLQQVLRKIVARRSFDVKRVLEELQQVKGIGRNLATKLLAMSAPDKYVVINDPVERALRAFGYPIKPGSDIDGEDYLQILRDLRSFIEECEGLGLQSATALDAFFYAYKDLGARG